MQYHNDDMDELFRRAAEDYPLNTRGADWEKVHAVLLAKDEPRQTKSKYRFLWLLLLLPVVLICSPLMDGMIQSAMPVLSTISPAENKPELLPQTGRVKRNVPQASGMEIKTQTTVSAESRSAQHILSQQLPVEKVIKGYVRMKIDAHRIASVEKKSPPPAQKKQDNPATEHSFALSSALLHFEKEDRRLKMQAPATEFFGKSSVAFSDATAADAGKTTKRKTTKQRRFYAGVVAGPDLSTVQFEKFSKTGFQAGILLGYQLSNRISIEAAALSSKKYYYSEGEYVRSSKIYRPIYAELLSADGNCRMLELPVSLQYAFSKKAKHTWFAAAGISSYLMKKEDYTYDYLYLNSGSVVSYRKIYENQTRNLFSVLQFSAGYTLHLGSGSNLRVEPYYSLPLKGIGYGELPLSSIGLRVGITTKRF